MRGAQGVDGRGDEGSRRSNRWGWGQEAPDVIVDLGPLGNSPEAIVSSPRLLNVAPVQAQQEKDGYEQAGPYHDQHWALISIGPSFSLCKTNLAQSVFAGMWLTLPALPWWISQVHEQCHLTDLFECILCYANELRDKHSIMLMPLHFTTFCPKIAACDTWAQEGSASQSCLWLSLV